MKAANQSLAHEFPVSVAPVPVPVPATEKRETESASYSGPDVILPEQHFDRSLGLEEVSGERALMLAVLEDGIRCYQEHLHSSRVRARLQARQAERWIRSDDWEWPFSFNNICESLSIQPQTLRDKLLQPLERPQNPRPRASTHRVYRLTPRVKPPRKR